MNALKGLFNELTATQNLAWSVPLMLCGACWGAAALFQQLVITLVAAGGTAPPSWWHAYRLIDALTRGGQP